MGKKYEDLKSDVKHELQNLEKLMDELKFTNIGHDISSRRIVGSILHDSYNCCERIFRLIVGEINGAIPVGFEWHRQLLNKVTHEVEGLRPPVISEQMASDLEEYLEFRHVFRNIYGFELLGDRIIRLKERHSQVFGSFIKEIMSFIDKLY
ncbi:MAG: hypothetical protein HRF42_08910 [Candidatus Brocadia sp.]|jgi:hypothetical protein